MQNILAIQQQFLWNFCVMQKKIDFWNLYIFHDCVSHCVKCTFTGREMYCGVCHESVICTIVTCV